VPGPVRAAGEDCPSPFQVLGSDPHRFDGDNDRIGCES
jgi:hypothetical protein